MLIEFRAIHRPSRDRRKTGPSLRMSTYRRVRGVSRIGQMDWVGEDELPDRCCRQWTNHLQPIPAHQQPNIKRNIEPTLDQRDRHSLDLRLKRNAVVKSFYRAVYRLILFNAARLHACLQLDGRASIVALEFSHLPLFGEH